MRSGISWLTFIFVASLVAVGCSKSDLSSPKAAAKSFMHAMQAGDGAAANACSVGADPKAVDAMAKMVAAQKNFRDAAVSKFGDQAKTMMMGDDFTDADKSIDEGTEQITGDTATVTSKKGGPIKLKKVGGDWKVDMTDMREAPDTASFDALTKAMNEMTDEVKAGKHKTAADAQVAMQAKMMAAMMGGGEKK